MMEVNKAYSNRFLGIKIANFCWKKKSSNFVIFEEEKNYI